MKIEVEIGQIAYAAYFESCGGKSINGESLPTWYDLPPEIRQHWRAAADAVQMYSDIDKSLKSG